MTPEEEGLREIEKSIEEARRLLLSPSAESLDRSCAVLEQACASLSAWNAAHRGKLRGASGAREMLATVRRGVARVAALLENAAAFRIGLSQQLALMAGGYTRTGEPARPQRQGTVSLEG